MAAAAEEQEEEEEELCDGRGTWKQSQAQLGQQETVCATRYTTITKMTPCTLHTVTMNHQTNTHAAFKVCHDVSRVRQLRKILRN